MVVTILEKFIDKHTGRQYEKGEKVEFNEERAKELAKLKLCTMPLTSSKSGEKQAPKTRKVSSKKQANG